jgi:hypothetical protein
MPKTTLSKSQFIRGLQCHKSLWLYKNRLDLRAEPDANQLAIFNAGTNVGELAQDLFPDGVAILYEEGSFEEKVAKTRRLINSGVKTIYEATFQFDDVLVMVDILNKGEDGWELYEVKSSTKVKLVHENDVAVQYYVLTGSGIELNKASLVHINNQYTRQNELDVKQLFTIKDLTGIAIAKQGWVKEEIQTIKDAIKASEPRIDIGPHCSDPYGCDFKDHCWKHIPDPSVFNISRLEWKKRWALYNDGIIKFEDLPKDYSLNPKQSMQIEVELTGKSFIDKKAIEEFLNTLHYPLYYLDFETFNPAVPFFDGVRPYQRIPFQYSIHYQETKGSKINHYEFLAEEGTDPREKMAQRLVDDIPEGSCVLAYNCGFEKSVIRELAEQFPQHNKHLMSIHESTLDLMKPFQNRHLYKKEMKGSYSIKYVLPALVPELSYKDLEISEGGQASDTYAQLHLTEDKDEVDGIRESLKIYCKLDTLAMVKILEFLEAQV